MAVTEGQLGGAPVADESVAGPTVAGPTVAGPTVAGARRETSPGVVARIGACRAAIRADFDAVCWGDSKYAAGRQRRSIYAAAVHRIGFQMMIAYRVMRLFRDLKLTFLAKIASRAIRHIYAAELHWDATMAPGVIIVHGTGLVVSHAAVIGHRCILFQHVTLGESIHPDTRVVGSPTLEADVHVGAGATLLGPITIGRGSKITAGAVIMRSVPPDSVVETPTPTIRARLRREAESDAETLGPAGA